MFASMEGARRLTMEVETTALTAICTVSRGA
jgi:hypothetical protein